MKKLHLVLITFILTITAILCLSSCGNEEGTTTTLPEGCAHKIVPIQSKPASCTEDGLSGGKQCSICNVIFEEQTVVPKYGHNFEEVKGKSPTCLEVGLTDGTKCSNCGLVEISQKQIEKLPHNEETITGKTSTCYSKGLTDGKKCTVCNTITLAQTVISKLPHSFENDVCTVCKEIKGSDGLEYKKLGSFYAVSGIGTCTDKHIVVPKEYNDLPVKQIWYDAFMDSDIESIILQDGITEIYDFAFSYCTKLTSINLPSTLTYIGERAFNYCDALLESVDGVYYVGNWAIGLDYSLPHISIREGTVGIAEYAHINSIDVESIYLPSTLKYLCSGAFYGGSSITSVTIPYNVEYIGEYLFDFETAVTSVTFRNTTGWRVLDTEEIPLDLSNPETNLTYLSKTYDNNPWVRIGDSECAHTEEDIPYKAPTCTDTGLTVGKKCSKCNAVLKEQDIIAKTLHSMENGECKDCHSLESLEYILNEDESSYTVIGIGTFSGENLIIPDTYKDLPVTVIGDGAFQNCKHIKSVTIGVNVEKIGIYAFRGCSALEVINYNVQELEDHRFPAYDPENAVFYRAGSEEKGITLNIGASVKYLPTYFFVHSNIKTAIFDESSTLTTVDDLAFHSCYRLESVILCPSITSIGIGTFNDCRALTSINLPSGLTKISDSAFWNCDSLKTITIPASVDTIQFWAFSACDSLERVVFENTEGWIDVLTNAPIDTTDPEANAENLSKLLDNTNWERH